MSDIDMINEFLQRTDHNKTEQIIKSQLIELDASLKSLSQEREKLANALKEKEIEFLKLSGAFDTQLKLVIALSKIAASAPFETVPTKNQ